MPIAPLESEINMPAQPIRFGGMPLGSRLMWTLAWNRRALYLAAAFIGVASALELGSLYGLLAGIIPLIVLYRATAYVNETAPALITAAKEMSLRVGSQRVGVPIEKSTPFCIAKPQGIAPFGVTAAPTYSFVCLYITDEYFATFSGSTLSLPLQTLEPSTNGEEVYFRHVTAINHASGTIEVELSRGQKVKRIEIGDDPQSRDLLEQLRRRFRTPTAVQNPEVPLQFAPELPPLPVPTVASAFPAEEERFCYLRVGKLNDYYADPAVIDALMEQLDVPGTVATHRAMTIQQKQAAIEAQAEHFSQTPTSFWYRVPRKEILAASLWRCRGHILRERVVKDRFYEVAREEDLRRPVGRWLLERGDDPYMEVQLGRRRIDVLGLNKRTQRLTAIELKNSDAEFRRGPDQMGSFAEYAHAVYLACTPAFAADYLERHAEHRAVNHWDPTLLDRKLKQGGFGLLIVERDRVFEIISPVEQTPIPERLDKIVAGLAAFHRIDLD